jgi:hypothetical protein
MTTSRAMSLVADGEEWFKKVDYVQNVDYVHDKAAKCFYHAIRAAACDIAEKLDLHLHSPRSLTCFYDFLGVQVKRSSPENYGKAYVWGTCYSR